MKATIFAFVISTTSIPTANAQTKSAPTAAVTSNAAISFGLGGFGAAAAAQLYLGPSWVAPDLRSLEPRGFRSGF